MGLPFTSPPSAIAHQNAHIKEHLRANWPLSSSHKPDTGVDAAFSRILPEEHVFFDDCPVEGLVMMVTMASRTALHKEYFQHADVRVKLRSQGYGWHVPKQIDHGRLDEDKSSVHYKLQGDHLNMYLPVPATFTGNAEVE